MRLKRVIVRSVDDVLHPASVKLIRQVAESAHSSDGGGMVSPDVPHFIPRQRRHFISPRVSFSSLSMSAFASSDSVGVLTVTVSPGSSPIIRMIY